MDQLIEAIVLPDAWMGRVLAKMRITDEIERLENERISVERRMRRLGQVYLDNLSITRSTVVRSEFWRTGFEPESAWSRFGRGRREDG